MSRSRLAIGIFAVTAVVGFALASSRSTEASPTPAAAIDSLPSPAGPGSAEPNLAVGPKGETYLSWLEPTADSGHAFRMATLLGSRWSTPATIRTGRDFIANWADFPSMVVLDGGRLAAHWLQRSGTGRYAYGVRIAQSADGGNTWSAPIVPHRDTSQAEHGFVAMWAEKGKLGAVWLDGRKSQHEGHGEMMLLSTTIGPDGKLGPETVVDSRTCDCCQNSAAIAAAGPVVAYRDRTADEIRDIYVTRQVNGKWTEGVAVHNDNWKINACPVNGPMVTASGTNVAVAWFTAPRDSARVNVAFSVNGGARFGAPIRIDAGRPSGRVALVLLPDGSAVVSWLERTGGDVAAVMARRVTPMGELGPIRTVAMSSAARASGFPRMVLSGSSVLFAWTVPTKPSGIRVARATISEFR